MSVPRTVLVVLALLLLGAHLSRAGAPLGAAIGFAAVTIALLFVRRPWAGWTIRAVLVLGALEWLRVLAVYARRRAEAGEPWTRLAVILGVVAAVTALAARVYRPRSPARPAPADG